MILITDTYFAHLVLPADHSHISGHYYFTNLVPDYSKVIPTPNGPILEKYKTLKTVVYSFSEAETGGTFKNTQNVIPLQHIIETAFIHRKLTKGSPIVTHNLTSQGILTSFIKNCKSKTWYMIYHWLEDCISQIIIQLISKLGI